jgi:integrase
MSKPAKLVKRSKSWAVEYYDARKGFTTRTSLGTDSFEVAEEKFAEWLLSRKPSVARDISDISVMELVATFYANVAKDYPSKYAYASALSYVEEHLKGLPLSEFDYDAQESFIDDLREDGLAEGTIGRVMAVINTSAIYAYKRKRIKEKPYVMSVSGKNPRQRTLTDEEAKGIIDSAKTENEKRFVLLAFTTMARPQAIIDLSKDQFDLRRNLLDLNPPGRLQTPKKYRPVIPICNTVVAECDKWPRGPIFPNHGTKLASSRSIVSKLKFPEGGTAYTIRHTMATELLSQGVPDIQISQFLGHRPPGVNKVTLDYAKYKPEFLKEATEAVEQYWRRVNGISTQADSGDAGGDCKGDEGSSGQAGLSV